MDIGLGKRIASIVAKRMAGLLSEMGEKPDPLLMTRERFMAHESVSQGAIMLDGTENASVVYSRCCHPLPGDKIIGYLGRGEGLAVHTADCSVGLKLQQKDSERFIGVEWSDEPMRSFETSIRVTVVNTKGVLARVAGTLANSEVDIVHVEMGQASAQDADLGVVLLVDALGTAHQLVGILQAEEQRADHALGDGIAQQVEKAGIGSDLGHPAKAGFGQRGIAGGQIGDQRLPLPAAGQVTAIGRQIIGALLR